MNAKSGIIAAVVFMFFAVLANGAPVKMSVSADVNSGIFKVTYKSNEAGKVKISIFGAAHELVFTETLARIESFVRPYNLSNLAQGEYTIVVEDRNGRSEEKIDYTFKKVSSAVEITKIANEADKYLLNIQNSERDLIQVRIYDNDGNLLHEQSMSVKGSFSVIYNLSKVKTNPVFEVTGSDGESKRINY